MTADNDVVIVSAVRTAVGSFNGGLSTLPAHKLGETVIRDEPVTIELMQAVEHHLHEKWREATQQEPRDLQKLLKIARQGTWYTTGFCSTLRGEEMVMMELAGTRSSIKFLSKPLGTLKPHYDLVVAG